MARRRKAQREVVIVVETDEEGRIRAAVATGDPDDPVVHEILKLEAELHDHTNAYLDKLSTLPKGEKEAVLNKSGELRHRINKIRRKKCRPGCRGCN